MNILKFKKDRRLGVAQEKRQYDLPLNRSIGTGFLVLLIALMTFLGVMALASSFALHAMTSHWSSGLENKVTIEIPPETSEGTLRTNTEIDALEENIGTRLKDVPYIKNITIMDDKDIEELISPWLGEGGLLKDMPLPGLISLELHITNAQIIQNLEKEIAEIDTDIRIDTHQQWLSNLLQLTGAMQFTALMVVMIIGFTTVAAVAGAIRTRMAVHKEEVELLHLMGASDEYITQQLQRHALLISLKGGAAGILTGTLMIALISILSGDTAAALLPSFNFGIWHMLGLLAVPAAICLIASAAARFTVLRVLSVMP